MTSLILQTAARLLQPLMLFVSAFFLLRGHDEPGGGFVGGLVAASAFGLQSLAFDVRTAREALRLDLRSFIGGGLVLAILTAVTPMLLGEPLFTALWVSTSFLGLGPVEVGSPLFFDVGVYLVVAGTALSFLFALEEA
jgi:multicomponent Na+:H+ antiporter subunit B